MKSSTKIVKPNPYWLVLMVFAILKMKKLHDSTTSHHNIKRFRRLFCFPIGICLYSVWSKPRYRHFDRARIQENFENSTWQCCSRLSYIVQAIELKLCSYVVPHMYNNLPKFQRICFCRMQERWILKIVSELLGHPSYFNG